MRQAYNERIRLKTPCHYLRLTIPHGIAGHNLESSRPMVTELVAFVLTTFILILPGF